MVGWCTVVRLCGLMQRQSLGSTPIYSLQLLLLAPPLSPSLSLLSLSLSHSISPYIFGSGLGWLLEGGWLSQGGCLRGSHMGAISRVFAPPLFLPPWPDLVYRQLLEEGGGEDEQLHVGAVQHLHQVHHNVLQGGRG